jgi:hypothetical protein
LSIPPNLNSVDGCCPSPYALTVCDDLLNKRVGILKILSGKAMGFNAKVKSTGQAHELDILIETVDLVSVPKYRQIDIAMLMRFAQGV